MRSAIYSGMVKHSRVLPRAHEFCYPVSMFYLSYVEIPQLCKQFALLSYSKFNFLSFNPNEYLTIAAIKQHISDKGYYYEDDNVFLLTNLSYLGYCYNPVSFYYCYDTDDVLQYILAEINNTPWDERYVYVLSCDSDDINKFSLDKQFHISPFMPMEMQYQWDFSHISEHIKIKLQNYIADSLQFEATLGLKKSELSSINLLKYVLKYPFSTQRTLIRIYWQAFRLWLKRVPFYSHARNVNEQ
jgi:DUF1365 family protein